MTKEEIKLKKDILLEKKRYKSDRDKIIGKPISYRISEEERKQIIHKYTVLKLTAREIARIYSRDKSSIINLLRNSGIDIISSKTLSTKYKINENYFENIDCHKKAYWLGWLMSDGNVSSNGIQIVLKLQCRDKYILQEFRNDLNSTHPIKKIANKPSKGSLLRKCGKKKIYYSYQFRINCAKMVLDLAKYGMVRNKGKRNLEIKNIPDQYISSFILGEFEGDGCIYSKNANPNGGSKLTIWDNKNHCIYIKSFLDKEIKKNVGLIYKQKHADVYVLLINKIHDLVDIHRIIYGRRDFNFCLKRKKDKFDKIINYYTNKLNNKVVKYRGLGKTGNGFLVRVGNKYVGYSSNINEAARIYDKFAREKYGDKAILNFPNE